MSGAVIKKVISKVRKVWQERKEKELEAESKKILKKAKKISPEIWKIIAEEFETEVNKKELKKDILWMLQNHMKHGKQYSCIGTEARNYIDDKLEIPNVDWFNNNESAHLATRMIGSKLMVINNLGYRILEFLRTGHMDEWADVVQFMKDYEEHITIVNNERRKD
jgi:ATP-dependent Lon protease